uniref:Gamma-glutamylaminecyclotransferase n=1 Tax=Denticeps clupeoides TaxID=299321 RepID=A0AAY4B9R7_9TELE
KMKMFSTTTNLRPFFTIMLPAVQMTRIFVYGTLKKGQPNNYRMLDPAKGKAIFCTNARTVDKYPLVIAGQFNIPFLLNIPGQGHHIQGEIYSVDDQMLRYLDHFESVPDMYQRTLIQLQVEETPGSCGHAPAAGTTVEAYLYSTTTYKPEWVNLQTFENYDSYGDHGLEYVTREARDD